MNVTLTVEGEPKATPRAKATSMCPKGCRGAIPGRPAPRPFVRMYTPAVAKEWKRAIMLAIKKHVPVVPHDCAFIVDCVFFLKRPQRLCRKRDPVGCVPHTVKPDLDNLQKAVLDAISDSGFWRDDCLVYKSTPEKHYTPQGHGTGATICIRSLEA